MYLADFAKTRKKNMQNLDRGDFLRLAADGSVAVWLSLAGCGDGFA